jgi:hypothetical protein
MNYIHFPSSSFNFHISIIVSWTHRLFSEFPSVINFFVHFYSKNYLNCFSTTVFQSVCPRASARPPLDGFYGSLVLELYLSRLRNPIFVENPSLYAKNYIRIICAGDIKSPSERNASRGGINITRTRRSFTVRNICLFWTFNGRDFNQTFIWCIVYACEYIITGAREG